MKHLRIRWVLAGIAALLPFAAVPAVASALGREPLPTVSEIRPHQGEAHDDDSATDPAVLWTVAAAGIGALGFGTLYLLKRRVGGFPQNPTWVAPITIMPSSELPGDATGADAAHGAHTHTSEH
ncbi:MAG: hypothetical protein ACR2HN_12525 [Tepidiformaceae bacterium]